MNKKNKKSILFVWDIKGTMSHLQAKKWKG